MSNNEKVYVLKHSYCYGKHNEFKEVKLIGIYSSKEKTDETIKRLCNVEGFNRYSIECFCADIYTLDEDNLSDEYICC